jgi:glycosyltransferase involved in cell wall biosynthesis
VLEGAANGYLSFSNRVLDGIRPGHVVSLGLVEAVARGVGYLARYLDATHLTTYDALFWSHDRAVSLWPWPKGTTAVYAYEDGALSTFRRARRQAMRRIWDLPLPHWRTLEAMWQAESERWPGAMGSRPPTEPEWKRRRKDGELALADVVSVASEFTRQSLESAGCAKPVVVIPYGFPVDQFRAKSKPPEGPFTVLSVGTHDLRKGTPYLLEAWKSAKLKNARLRLIGPMKLTDSFVARYAGLYEHVPHISKARLQQEYRAADLLALPTLGDGFGLVIQEAMCCGTAVVTTRCGGGPECITSGQDGWLVPERSVEALVETLRQSAANRDRLSTMGGAARRRAERWTWRDAGLAITAAL